MGSVSTAKNQAKRAGNKAKPWVEFLARLGFVAKGVVFIVIGILALQAAFGVRSANVNPNDALLKIITQPFGRVLLWVVLIGLVGYVIWQFVMAIEDPENAGNDTKGIAKRAGYFINAIGYSTLAYTAYNILMGRGGGSGNSAPKDFTARLLGNPIGPWIVGLVGLGLAVVGLYQFYRAYTQSFKKKLKLGGMNEMEKTWAIRSGQIGLSANGIVYLMIGIFLIQAATTHNPNKAGGLGDALVALAGQPYGPWILGAVAIGLIAYGIYAFVLARYRRIYV